MAYICSLWFAGRRVKIHHLANCRRRGVQCNRCLYVSAAGVRGERSDASPSPSSCCFLPSGLGGNIELLVNVVIACCTRLRTCG